MFDKDLSVLRRLAVFFWPRDDRSVRVKVGLALLSMIAAKLIVALLPILYKYVVDLIAEADGAQVALLVGLGIAAYAVGRFLSVLLIQVRDVLFVGVLHHARRALAIDTFRRLLGSSYDFFRSTRVGEIQQKVDRGVRSVGSMTDYLLFSIAPTVFEITVSAIAIAIFLAPVHALVIAVAAVAYVAFTIVLTEWRLKFRKRMNADEDAAKGVAVDAIVNYEIIKLQGGEDYEARRYRERLTAFEDSSVVNAKSLAAVNAGQAGIIAAATAWVLLVVGLGVVDGRYTIGQFAMMNVYLLQVFVPLGMFGFVYRQVRFGMTDLAGMFEMIDGDLPREEHGGTRAVGRISAITLRDVSFRYRDAETPALENIDLEIASGRVLGIVGPTGAGKTTLLRLLFGLHVPTSGQLLVDGVDIREISAAGFRRQLGIVPQDTVLFHDTLRHNIAYGLSDVGDDEIMEAARLAEIAQDILAGPQDLDVVVGERGSRISGGQRQRVALARALVRKPSVLVFDEGTSALDTITERRIVERIYALARERGYAVVIVTHRMANVVDADEIVVVEGGRIVARGTHEALVRDGGIYARLQHGDVEKVG